VQLPDLVGVHPRPVGHVHPGLPGRAPGVQLPGLLGCAYRPGELHEGVGVGGLVQRQATSDRVEQSPLLALIPEAFGGLGAEHHRDADVAEPFGEVDGLVGALDGGELVEDHQHVVADPGLAAGGEVAEVFQDQAAAASASVRLAMVGMVSTARSTSSRPQQPSTLPWRERKKAE
jgi:hypothetical protein